MRFGNTGYTRLTWPGIAHWSVGFRKLNQLLALNPALLRLELPCGRWGSPTILMALNNRSEKVSLLLRSMTRVTL